MVSALPRVDACAAQTVVGQSQCRRQQQRYGTHSVDAGSRATTARRVNSRPLRAATPKTTPYAHTSLCIQHAHTPVATVAVAGGSRTSTQRCDARVCARRNRQRLSPPQHGALTAYAPTYCHTHTHTPQYSTHACCQRQRRDRRRLQRQSGVGEGRAPGGGGGRQQTLFDKSLAF